MCPSDTLFCFLTSLPPMRLSAQQLAKACNIDRRTVTNWLNEKPACPSTIVKRTRYFDLLQVIEWREQRAVRQARAQWEKDNPRPDELKDARDRKAIVETRILELELGEREGRLIPLEVHEQRVRSLCEPLAARCKSLGKYMGDVQLATTDVEAMALLEKMGDDLLASLMGAADDLDDGDSSEADDAAA